MALYTLLVVIERLLLLRLLLAVVLSRRPRLASASVYSSPSGSLRCFASKQAKYQQRKQRERATATISLADPLLF